jgi:hypothetical protein
MSAEFCELCSGLANKNHPFDAGSAAAAHVTHVSLRLAGALEILKLYLDRPPKTYRQKYSTRGQLAGFYPFKAFFPFWILFLFCLSFTCMGIKLKENSTCAHDDHCCCYNL